MKVKQTTRRSTPYIGEQDTAKIVWSNATHRSVHEAFRDADYATPVWKPEPTYARVSDYAVWAVLWLVFFSSLYFISLYF